MALANNKKEDPGKSNLEEDRRKHLKACKKPLETVTRQKKVKLSLPSGLLSDSQPNSSRKGKLAY